MTYCDWSDLLVSDCQHCKDGKQVTGNATKAQLQYGDGDHDDHPYTGPSKVFMAKFPGKCGACGQTIHPGQDIYMANGAPHHAGE